MSLHRGRRQAGGRGKGGTGHRVFWAANSHADADSRSAGVEVGNWCTGGKAEATGTGARVGDAGVEFPVDLFWGSY